MKTLFSQSENFKSEYSCSIVQIGELTPIEDSDFLVKTMINGFPIVIRKDCVKEGDIMFYAPIESELNADFCRINNLYDDPANNDDPNKKGYFNKYGRVRIVKLRGQESLGFLFTKEEMERFIHKTIVDMPIDTYFDTIDGILFVKAYVPRIKENTNEHHTGRGKRKVIKKFNRLIPGEFFFHYDTSQFENNIKLFNPEDIVSISVKLHGTSAIIGNLNVLEPKFGNWYKKIFTRLPKWLQFTKTSNDYICSSRKIIINDKVSYVNKQTNDKSNSVQNNILFYNNLFKKYDVLPNGWTIYGEIIGFFQGTDKPIQKLDKPFDYKCLPGTNKLMIYRITNTLSNGENVEWNVDEVYDWTINTMELYPELKDYLHPIDILYHGKLKDLYPDLPLDDHWHENLLERMKNEKKWFMEMNEPLCKNKVPREGIVIRKDNDKLREAFKLKTMKYRFKECKSIDEGNFDEEMVETYNVSCAESPLL